MSAPPNLVLTTGPQTTQITAAFSIPGSAATGTIVQATVSAFGPLVGSQTTIVVPITEVWHVIDLYVVSTPTIDATLLTFINGYIQNIQPALSTTNINLLTRFRLPQSIPLAPGATFSSSISTLEANSSTLAVSQNVFYQIVRAPFTGSSAG